MHKLFKQKPKLVRLQHKDVDDFALEGIWTGMVDGHYHLTAVKTVTPKEKLPIGDVYVHPSKVLFLETIAVDSA